MYISGVWRNKYRPTKTRVIYKYNKSPLQLMQLYASETSLKIHADNIWSMKLLP
jgi:hypothetical protein